MRRKTTRTSTIYTTDVDFRSENINPIILMRMSSLDLEKLKRTMLIILLAVIHTLLGNNMYTNSPLYYLMF